MSISTMARVVVDSVVHLKRSRSRRYWGVPRFLREIRSNLALTGAEIIAFSIELKIGNYRTLFKVIVQRNLSQIIVKRVWKWRRLLLHSIGKSNMSNTAAIHGTYLNIFSVAVKSLSRAENHFAFLQVSMWKTSTSQHTPPLKTILLSSPSSSFFSKNQISLICSNRHSEFALEGVDIIFRGRYKPTLPR